MPRITLFDEARTMICYFILLGLVLLSVYVSRVPPNVLRFFQGAVGQFIGIVLVIGLTSMYGWVHGVLAALAFALVLSRAMRARRVEGFEEYIPAVVLPESQDTVIIPKNHRWFVEKVLGENPFLIREKEVTTQAVQDLSERGMGSNSSSFSR